MHQKSVSFLINPDLQYLKIEQCNCWRKKQRAGYVRFHSDRSHASHGPNHEDVTNMVQFSFSIDRLLDTCVHTLKRLHVHISMCFLHNARRWFKINPGSIDLVWHPSSQRWL